MTPQQIIYSFLSFLVSITLSEKGGWEAGGRGGGRGWRGRGRMRQEIEGKGISKEESKRNKTKTPLKVVSMEGHSMQQCKGR